MIWCCCFFQAKAGLRDLVRSRGLEDVIRSRQELAGKPDYPVVHVLGEAFAAAGEELALVGGPVRDAIMGRRSIDLDFATSANPAKILTIVVLLYTSDPPSNSPCYLVRFPLSY